ncbi:hypothetical protein [Roseovarius sp. ZX-A-9]|uniref:hypothetical protein n=1 Tax=Roseovarius sp. ZX-A-9 TaxID=3014783 RepID=UPI00232E58AA|nr:hypothetical protein [Roseovarius sp. ZX-A-9]
MMRLAIAAFAVAAATQGHAEAFNSDGVASGQSTSELIEFGPDHKVLNSRITYTKFEMANKSHPMNQLSGRCFGTVELRGGAADGNGVCVLDGLEGDRVLMGWVARRMNPKGEIIGYWTVNSGTGLYLQASGGGTFTSNVNQANGTAVNTLRGAVTLR